MRTIWLPCLVPDWSLTTACQRGSSTAASLVSTSTRRARGSAIRSTNCSKIAGRAPERLDAGDVLAGQHEVDALRAAAPGDVLQQHGGRLGHRVVLGEQVLELVDHGDDPRPAAAGGSRPRARSSSSLRHLVPPWPPSARRRISSERNCSRASPNSRSVLMLTPTSLACGSQVGPVRPGRELGERHALLEVEQVELQLVRAVPGGQRADHREQQVGLARPARAADQRVRRARRASRIGDRLALGEPDRRVQPARCECCRPHGPAGSRSSKTATRLRQSSCSLGDRRGRPR